MAQRIGAKDITVSLGYLKVCLNQITLDIEDNIEVAKDDGIPNGWVAGDVGAGGDAEVDALALSILTEEAESAGSWRDLPEFDVLFHAKVASGEELKVEAFGCKFSMESLINANKNEGGSKHVSKLKFIVTSPDFVRINGVPYLGAKETANIVRPE